MALFIVVSGVALTTVIIKRHSGANSVSTPSSKNLQGVDLSLQQIHLSETEGRNRKWELFADAASYDKGKELTRLKHVRFIVQSLQNTGALTVTADHGCYWNLSKNVTLSGNINAVNNRGFQFVAEDLEYRADSSLLLTTGAVSMSNGPLMVKGIGMELKSGDMQAKILKQVEAVVEAESR